MATPGLAEWVLFLLEVLVLSGDVLKPWLPLLPGVRPRLRVRLSWCCPTVAVLPPFLPLLPFLALLPVLS